MCVSNVASLLAFVSDSADTTTPLLVDGMPFTSFNDTSVVMNDDYSFDLDVDVDMLFDAETYMTKDFSPVYVPSVSITKCTKREYDMFLVERIAHHTARSHDANDYGFALIELDHKASLRSYTDLLIKSSTYGA